MRPMCPCLGIAACARRRSLPSRSCSPARRVRGRGMRSSQGRTDAGDGRQGNQCRLRRDFNGDGLQDLYLILWKKLPTDACGVIWWGSQTGAFSDCATVQDPKAKAVGDFNGDGLMDTMGWEAASAKSWVNLSQVDKDGKWGCTRHEVNPSGIAFADAGSALRIVADLDGDGKSDILYRSTALLDKDNSRDNALWFLLSEDGVKFKKLAFRLVKEDLMEADKRDECYYHDCSSTGSFDLWFDQDITGDGRPDFLIRRRVIYDARLVHPTSKFPLLRCFPSRARHCAEIRPELHGPVLR